VAVDPLADGAVAVQQRVRIVVVEARIGPQVVDERVERLVPGQLGVPGMRREEVGRADRLEHPRADPGDLLQADLVDQPRVHVGRGHHAELVGVVRLPFRPVDRRNRVAAGRHVGLAEEAAEPRQRLPRLRQDLLLEPLSESRDLGSIEGGRHALERPAQAVEPAGPGQRLDLLRYARHRDARRHAPLAHAERHPLDHVPELAGNLLEAPKVAGVVGGRLESHVLAHLRNVLVRSEPGADRREERPKAVRLDVGGEDELQQLQAHLVLVVERRPVDLPQLREEPLAALVPPLDGVDALVGDPVGVGIVSEAHRLFGKLLQPPPVVGAEDAVQVEVAVCGRLL
jgi:hypothetical protein